MTFVTVVIIVVNKHYGIMVGMQIDAHAPTSEEFQYLSQLADAIAERHQSMGGREIEEMARNAGHMFSRTTYTRMRRRQYYSTPTDGMIHALAYLAGVDPAEAYRNLNRELPPAGNVKERDRRREIGGLNRRRNEPLTVYIGMALPRFEYDYARMVRHLNDHGHQVSIQVLRMIGQGTYNGNPRDSILYALAAAADVEPALVFDAMNRDLPRGITLGSFPRDFESLSVDARALVVELFDRLIIAEHKGANNGR